MRGLALLVGGVALSVGAAGTVASAETKPALATVVGATEVARFTTPTGFIDDVVAFDNERVVYVVADGSSRAELRLVTLATKAEVTVDISATTTHPVALQLAWPRAFVVGQNDDGSQMAALVELTGKQAGTAVWKAKPAQHMTIVMRDGKSRLAVHRTTEAAGSTRHEVELLALENGGRLAGPRTIEVAGGNAVKALDLRINHWSDGFTRAHGIKGGAWDPKENMRSADVEASYDVVLGKLDTKKIDDLFEQRKRFQALVDAGGTRIDFVRITADASSAQLWRNGKPRPLELDQQLSTYDPKSVQSIVQPDGSAWIALKVDPVNPDAVARKKADPEYLDIFRVPSDGKAVRKSRVLAAGIRHRFGVVSSGGDKFWLIERNQGFERGGKALVLYQPQ